VPDGETPYLHLEDGLADLFDSNAPEPNISIEKGVWLWESGINYKHPLAGEEDGTQFLSDQSNAFEVSRTIVLTLTEGLLNKSEVKNQISLTDSDILSSINSSVVHQVTDVRFESETSTDITFTVISYFVENPVFSSFSQSSATPISYTCDPGAVAMKADCNEMPSAGTEVWEDMQKGVRMWLPYPHLTNWSGFNTNVVGFSTYVGSSTNRYLDGTYLPGHEFAIHPDHDHNSEPGDCLSKSHNKDYGNKLHETIQDVLVKRTYWDGVAYLNIYENAGVGTYKYICFATFAKWIKAPNSHTHQTPF
jgi:hypothetical protein